MKILFISAFNLTTNPRLRKELLFAISQGHTVDLIGIDLGGWSARIDRQLIPDIKARKMVFLPVTRENFLQWMIWSVAEKSARLFWHAAKKNLFTNTLVHSRRSIILWNYLRRFKPDYDLVIAHTLPALYPAWRFSTKHKLPFIFDMEDYYPGERCSAKEQNRRQFLLTRLLPSADFITCASPMICEHTLRLIPDYPADRTVVINNSFPSSDFELKHSQQDKVQFVWFSQNIAAGRGLELIVPVVYQLRDRVHLTIIGNLYSDFYHDFLAKYQEALTIKPPMPEPDLNRFLCEFDIGLAMELNTADFNRQICLTNKIFAYSQAGLYVLATDTPAQKDFISQHKILGMVTGQSQDQILAAVKEIINQKQKIRKQKHLRFEYARTHLAWEKETEKLKQIWHQLTGY